ncbi:MAG: hypothetical protein V1706_08725 [Pseudomonadota bacterium]
MDGIEKLIDSMEIEDALAAIATVANRLLSQISDEARLNFVVSLIGDSGADKVSSMVNL